MAFQKARALQEAEKSVSQGKVAQAIKQYLAIFEYDPSDLSLLNTIGDLYIRDRNVTEGLRQFHRLAEAYVREGFNVKAIAIYRKISKVDPNSIETLLKLADLYQQQGLSREAREQYLQVVDFYRKRNQTDKVLEVLHKLVQLDPDNLNFRNRLATEMERAGKRAEAAAVCLESAEISLRHDDHSTAEPLLRMAAELDPQNSKVHLLRARVAMARNQPAEVESIINSSATLQSDPAGKHLLLDAYIALRRIPDAAKLAKDVFDANPSDLTPISTVSWLLTEMGQIDDAYRLVESVAQSPAGLNHSGTLLDILHQIRAKAPNHIPTLELMLQICERTADGGGLAEVLQGLGHAYELAGDLEKAEGAYQKLTEREPEEEKFLNLLNGVRQKLGKEITPLDFTDTPIPITEQEDELPPQTLVVDADQELMVKEALENSDLFARYNLTEKAIAELEKVLQIYPDQVEVHRRILELSRKGFPQRGATAAAQLARIFRSHGDEDLAAKYDAIAQGTGSLQDIPAMPNPSAAVETSAPPAPPDSPPESAAPLEFPIPAPPTEESAGAATPPPGQIALDVPPWEIPANEPQQAPPPSPAGQQMEVDLSDDLEALARMIPEDPEVEVADPDSEAPLFVDLEAEEITIHADTLAPPLQEQLATEEISSEAPTAAPGIAEEAAPTELEDGKVEVEFYLENDFVEEARQTVAKLEGKFPGNARVEELRRKVDERGGKLIMPAQPAEDVHIPRAGDVNVPATAEPATPVTEGITEPAPESNQDIAAGVPETLAAPINDEPPVEIAAATTGEVDALGDLAGDLNASLEGFTPSGAPPPSPVHASAAPEEDEVLTTPTHPYLDISPLSGLLMELDEPLILANSPDDPETHYNLGVAFREMGLLDESIGEFQKVVRGAGKGNYPSNFLQACSLLAICFMEKKMPAIAVNGTSVRWKHPDLDEEALMALQYDLGVAYEQAGDSRNALERFTEVYSQNIDFRDVADKIRELQQKV